MTTCIREATPQDTSAISSLVSHLTGKLISPLHIENRLHNMRGNPDELLYVYEEKNRILGTLSFRIRRDHAAHDVTFSEISVISYKQDPDSNQAPLAQLRSYAEQLASDHNCSGMMWLTDEESTDMSRSARPPIGFHETGYRFVKRFL
ncbi:hypothetical protein PAECIP111891_06258 [Paenibacillus allorhizoplanae]|uniref:N-acetyltransferase domain-containing protein n=1 Tax=Paenibacillus allorhizoplanae TaxID=2905648 RepID=A0ABM9CXG5_9BACL|nr:MULTISPECIES: hypothetical protein [Paenibacillus]KRE58299.1 hypothetical protein ASL11_28475 [Paenibacillus sp. Soil750]CAH1228251.1 hypothetical protein PAECIP111891_06258 [Paenibacillus allorhizoplanae]